MESQLCIFLAYDDFCPYGWFSGKILDLYNYRIVSVCDSVCRSYLFGVRIPYSNASHDLNSILLKEFCQWGQLPMFPGYFLMVLWVTSKNGKDLVLVIWEGWCFSDAAWRKQWQYVVKIMLRPVNLVQVCQVDKILLILWQMKVVSFSYSSYEHICNVCFQLYYDGIFLCWPIKFFCFVSKIKWKMLVNCLFMWKGGGIRVLVGVFSFLFSVKSYL